MRRSAWLFTALALLRVQLQPASACVKIENEEELQGLLQLNSYYENALVEYQRLISEKDCKISDLETKCSLQAEDLKSSQENRNKNEEEMKSLRRQCLLCDIEGECLLCDSLEERCRPLH